jgi:hypothetical protein
MTETDFNRISPINWGELLPKVKGRKLFRSLRPHEKKNTPYSNAIIEYDDGFCPFLVDNLCFIHGQKGSKFKPAMCQQFPYSFNETPSGIYATVSFVSMAVCHNLGKSLIEQRDYMLEKLVDFRALYPDAHPNWSKVELTGGKPIAWERYLEIEQEVLTRLQAPDSPLDERFQTASRYLWKLANAAQTAQNDSLEQITDNAQNAKNVDAADAKARESLRTDATQLKPIDKHLLLALHSTYFPTRILRPHENEFQVNRFVMQIALKGLNCPLKIAVPGSAYSIDELKEVQWSLGEPEVDDLLYRYFFSRIFGKLYFGAGFGQLTVIAGFNHLILIYALVKMQAKALAKSRGANRVNYLDVVATIRQLEKRLGEATLSGYAAAMFELLMYSPSRIDRVLKATA